MSEQCKQVEEQTAQYSMPQFHLLDMGHGTLPTNFGIAFAGAARWRDIVFLYCGRDICFCICICSEAVTVWASLLQQSLFARLLFVSFMMKLFSHHQSVHACVMERACMREYLCGGSSSGCGGAIEMRSRILEQRLL